MRKIYFWCFTLCFILQAWSSGLNAVTPETPLNVSITDTQTELSSDSDIVSASSAGIPSANIDYTIYNVLSGLTTTNSLAVGVFTVRDGGILGIDDDSNPTILNKIVFEITNSENIAAIALFDGETNVAESSTISQLTQFSDLNIVANDNDKKDFTVRVTFKSVVTDNVQLQLTITTARPDRESSLFALTNGGGAQTSTSGDDNRIEVTASQFQFDQQPTDGNEMEVLVPFPTVIAVDANSNKDLDFNVLGIIINTETSSSILPESYDMINGEAVLDNVVFSSLETDVSLTASSSGLIPAISESFNITGPLFALAQQNFDSQTGWTYSSDTDFRTSSTTPVGVWNGPEGYFGEIAISNASPLSNSLFSDIVFGENDLNDTDNPLATITFADIDVTGITNLSIQFDWEVIGYNDDDNDIQYRLVLDGTAATEWEDVFDGNGSINDAQGRESISIADGFDTVGLQVRLRNNRDDGYSGFDNFKLVSQFNGLVYTAANGWEDNNLPDNTTASSDALVVSGTYNVENDAQLNNLFINNGASVFIDFGKSLTANNVFNTGNVQLNSISNNYSSLIVNGIVTNEVEYNRHVNTFTGSGDPAFGNDLIAAPVTNANQTFEALQIANPGTIPSGTIGGIPSFLFGPFDNNTNAYINYTTADNSSTINAGTGYRTASTAPSGSNFKFIGDVETGSIAVTTTVGTSSTFNLIGNPYPSYIRLDEFLAANSGEFDPSASGVYGFVGNSNSGFAIWNQAFSDANPNALIAPGQGFLVSSKAGGGLISFNPNMRSIGTSDDFITGRDGTNANLANMSLQLTKGDLIVKTALYFNDNATFGMDFGYDSALFHEVTPEFAIYSHLVENNTGIDLAAQSVSFMSLDNVTTIPIGIHAAQGEQITVSLADHNIAERTSIILEDNLNNTFTDLKTNDYIITPINTLSDTGRFYLHLSPETLSTAENILEGLNIFTASNTEELIIKGHINQNTSLNILDIQGRIMTTTVLKAQTSIHSISVSNFAPGIYVVELKANSKTRSQKIIID